MLFNSEKKLFAFDSLRMRVIRPEKEEDYAAAVNYCQNTYVKNLRIEKTISKKSIYLILEEFKPDGYEIISCIGMVFPNKNIKHFSESYLPYKIEDYMKIVSPDQKFDKDKMIELTALCSTSGDFTSRIMLICAPIVAFHLGYNYALVTITEMIKDVVSSKCHWALDPLVFSNTDYANINKSEWGRYYDFKPITCLVDLGASFESACNDTKDFLVRQCLGICTPIQNNLQNFG